MGVLWRGFDWKMPIFLSARSQFLAGSSHAAANFSKSARPSKGHYIVRTRQVSSTAKFNNSRVSSRRTFHEYFGQNGVNRGHNQEM